MIRKEKETIDTRQEKAPQSDAPQNPVTPVHKGDYVSNDHNNYDSKPIPKKKEPSPESKEFAAKLEQEDKKKKEDDSKPPLTVENRGKCCYFF